jgi:hypothetical protein
MALTDGGGDANGICRIEDLAVVRRPTGICVRTDLRLDRGPKAPRPQVRKLSILAVVVTEGVTVWVRVATGRTRYILRPTDR